MASKITNCYEIHRFEFYKRDRIVAKGSHKSRTSYLSWVRDEYALYTPHELANQANESAKIDVEKIKKATKIGLIHRRLGHLSMGRLTQVRKSVHDIEIQGGDFPKDCDICIHAKKTKLQNYSAVTRASKPLEQIYMDFWGPY